ncbi:hypothetical protein FLA4_03810 [Candidatus Rickettsia kotlanii]|nr:hypothetical protein FLA4_03810 [Candidatus Rickettsia kotlanii]BDU61214.1 hypothetical protein HM2_03820 [Candidatus Rickettsia kotlanii]
MIEIFTLSFGYKPNIIAKSTLDRMYKRVKSNKDVFGFKWQLIWPIDQKMIESYYALGWCILKVKGRSNKDLIFHSGYKLMVLILLLASYRQKNLELLF